MGINLAEQYYLKAKGAMSGFCKDWAEVCEALNYALSYDEDHVPSLHLLGRIKFNYLNSPEEAYYYFDKAIANDPEYAPVYKDYVYALINTQEYQKASKLLDYCIKIKTIDKAVMYKAKAYLFECNKDFDSTLTFLRIAKKHTYNDSYDDFLNDEIKRIKKKRKQLVGSKKEKAKKKKLRKKNVQ